MRVKFFAVITALVITAVSVQARSEEVDGAALYQDFCSVCHGDKGDGKSHAMQGLVPPPRDFTSPGSALELSKERISYAIREGLPGTAMTAWKSRLNDEQIEAITDYVRSAFMRPATESGPPGKKIYADYCSVCHGDTGEGAVWATSGLNPPPVNFTLPQTQAKLDRNRMVRSVAYGRPETAMTGWKDRLSDEEIEIVVDYVINTFMSSSDAHKNLQAGDASSAENTRADMSIPFPFELEGDATRGAALYMANCTACHGVTGDGRGPRAYFINPKPRNFLHTSSRASFNRPALFLAVSKGKLRTEMPAWDKVFDAQQMADVSEYVFQQFILGN
jgi:cbb3-type cytochrome c oxidase subunit III